jgi:hypothetical protein
MAFVGIERAWSGVRMFTVVPRLMRGALCVGSCRACEWLATNRLGRMTRLSM